MAEQSSPEPVEGISTATMTTDGNYVEEYLPPHLVEKLEAGAFRSLCSHLKERSDEVQNMDLMTVSGFCRNCLAKWMVVEARGLSDSLKTNPGDTKDLDHILQALDALGYDEAAQYVYGCSYGDWKKRHAQTASDEQMQRYKDSQPIHAMHDKDLLAPRTEKPDVTPYKASVPFTGTIASSLLSNVCCQDVDESAVFSTQSPQPAKKTRTVSVFQPPPPPKNGVTFSLGILTVSDRAAARQYETGDLSGPAVEDSVRLTLEALGGDVSCNVVHKAVVSDDVKEIQTILKDWGDCHLILTTGGTGFGKRDVTPEATLGILDRECRGLLTFVTTECSQQHQPLASLSRGTSGIRGNTLICNLPGNPTGVREIVPILLPLLLHAIVDMKQECM